MQPRGQFDTAALVKAVGNYASQKRKIRDFLSDYMEDDGKTRKYRNQIEDIARGQKVLKIDVDDFLKFFGVADGIYKYDPNAADKATDIINTLLSNTQRALRLFYDVVEELRREWFPAESGTVDVLERDNQERINQSVNLPTIFRVPYELRLIPPTKLAPTPIHLLRAEHVGTLVKLEGIVSRMTTVKPCLRVAVYRCDDCGNYEFQHIDTPTYLPLNTCTSQVCKAARRTDTLSMCMRESRFVKRQEATLQELQHLVPSGTVPRHIKVVLCGELTQVLRPGMSLTASGVFLPVLDGGYRHPMAPTACPTILEVHHLQPHRTAFDAQKAECTEEELNKILAETPSLYERMAESIAPAIHGHMDVKKALILQLVGGASESFGDGLKIRGDLHMLLMGDPGIAKSQLLIKICSVAPRAHYTCGKGASGVGLTASVVKDPVTGEFTLEGGAIVLADNGICCVDEFDKMQESDRTAIHEVMEQQTVSIAKAGLTATLNARTTILAAANPVFGRYDITKSAVTNIGLPAALLSRFDIVFLLLDQAGNYEKDLNMARHLLRIHRDKKVDSVGDDSIKPLTTQEIRSFIAKARAHVPKLSPCLADAIADQYVLLRHRDRSETSGENTYTTPRTLFALLRLSQAVARLRFADEITQEDFEEALRLMQASKLSVCRSRTDEGLGNAPRSQMLAMIREMTTSISGKSCWVTYRDAIRRAREEGLPIEMVEETVDSLVHAGSMMWDGPAKLRFRLQMAGLDVVEEEDDDMADDDHHEIRVEC